MMMESKEARIFSVRLIHKLSEALIGVKVNFHNTLVIGDYIYYCSYAYMKAMHSFLLAGSSISSSLWTDPWVQCCAEVTLLGDPLPLPGFSLTLGYQPDDSSKTKIMDMVRIPLYHIVEMIIYAPCFILWTCTLSWHKGGENFQSCASCELS